MSWQIVVLIVTSFLWVPVAAIAGFFTLAIGFGLGAGLLLMVLSPVAWAFDKLTGRETQAALTAALTDEDEPEPEPAPELDHPDLMRVYADAAVQASVERRAMYRGDGADDLGRTAGDQVEPEGDK